MWFERIKGKCGKMSRRQIAFGFLFAAGVLWLAESIWLLGRPMEQYVFEAKDLESEYGIYMENFLEGYGAGYYLDNGIEIGGAE